MYRNVKEFLASVHAPANRERGDLEHEPVTIRREVYGNDRAKRIRLKLLIDDRSVTLRFLHRGHAVVVVGTLKLVCGHDNNIRIRA